MVGLLIVYKKIERHETMLSNFPKSIEASGTKEASIDQRPSLDNKLQDPNIGYGKIMITLGNQPHLTQGNL